MCLIIVIHYNVPYFFYFMGKHLEYPCITDWQKTVSLNFPKILGEVHIRMLNKHIQQTKLFLSSLNSFICACFQNGLDSSECYT